MNKILAVIAFLESSGNPAAVNGNAVGLYQITPVVIADVNRITRRTYTLADRLHPDTAQQIAVAYIRHYLGENPSVEDAAALWRCGPTGMKTPTAGQWKYIVKAVELAATWKPGKTVKA